jgi:5-methylcytosine-specific restriction endonuclease McrA
MDYKHLPSTMQEAKRRGETYYFTGVPCKHGHLGPRFAANRRCAECIRQSNLERTKRDYWIGYGDAEYKERKRQAARTYYHQRKNYRHVETRRRNEKFSKVATEQGNQQLKRLRLEAQIKTIDSGVKHEVDHIIPLVHDKVCGLSVPANCQVITKAENRRKSSRFDQDKQSKIQLQLIKKAPGVGG